MEFLPSHIYEAIISGLAAVVVYFLARINNQVSKLVESQNDLRLLVAEKCLMKAEHEEYHDRERTSLDMSLDQRFRIVRLECLNKMEEAR